MGKKLTYNPKLTLGILAVILVISFVWYQTAVQAYDIVVGGKTIAQVKNKDDFTNALQQYKQQLSDQLGYPVQELADIEVRESKLDRSLLEENINKIILKDVNFGSEGYQLVVDDEPLFVVRDKNQLESLLKEYQQQYLKRIDENASIKRTDFAQNVNIEKTMVQPNEFIDIDQAKEIVYAKEKEATIIEVKSGDNLWVIAKRHDMAVSELEMLNPDADAEKIYPGDKLVINPFNPKLDVIIELENTVAESIPFDTEYRKDNSLYRRQEVLVKAGEEGKKEVTYDIALYNGLEESMKVINEKKLSEPVTRIVRVGTKQTVSRGGQRNYGVVQGSRVTSSYGWRTHPITGRRSFHDGVDIAARSGSSVLAFAEGKVVFAGWNGGYGNAIFIDHGNGLQTRYAHLSRINVSVGERVDTGDKIGGVGSTGRSTGPHLHFEVRQNGNTKSPFNYL